DLQATPDHLSYWWSYLDRFVFNPIRLRPRTLQTTLKAGCIARNFNSLSAPVTQLYSTYHCTPFVVYLASLGSVLQRHSLKPDAPVSVAWPADLRSATDNDIVGFATNTLVTVIDQQKRSVAEMIARTSQDVLSGLDHRHTDLSKFSNISSLFDVMLVMDPFSMAGGEDFELVEERMKFTKFPLTLFVQHSSMDVMLTAHFMEQLFDDAVASRILDEWMQLLISWASGKALSVCPPIAHSDTIVERSGQFVRVKDLQCICQSFVKSNASYENGKIILEYDKSVEESSVVHFIKHNVPLFLHPDIIRPLVSSPPSSLPLTPQQSQMYFLSQQDNNNNHYNVPFVQRFEKKIVKLDLLILALHFIRQSNEALRTHLIEMDGEPRQAVVSATESHFCIAPSQVPCDTVGERLLSRKELCLDLDKTPARLSLLDTGDELILFLVISHIICDGWSTSVLQQMLTGFYDQLSRGELPAMRKNSFEGYQKALDNYSAMETGDENYVKKIIGGIGNVTSALCTLHGKEMYHTFCLDHSLAAPLNRYASHHKTTPFSVLLRAIVKSVHLVFGIDRLTVGTPVANRTPSNIDVIGCFMNTLTIPVDATSTEVSFYNEVRMALQLNIPNFELLRVVRTELKTHDVNLFEVFVNCRYGMESESNLAMDGVKSSEIHLLPPIYPLEVYIEVEKEEYIIQVKMKRSDEETIRNVADAILQSLRSIVSTNTVEETRVWTSSSERSDIPSSDLASILQRNSQLCPDLAAIITPLRSLTYSELWNELTAMATLIREEFFTTSGGLLRPDDVVGIKMQHGEDALLTCLAVLIAGGAYLPLLDNWPQSRVRHAVGETNCSMVIEELNVDGRRKETERRWRRRNMIDDAAYVIYTSGTTGKPKGVVAAHRGVVNMLNSTTRNLSIRMDDVVYQFTKFVFDNSVLEVWLSLASSSTLFIDTVPFTHHRFIENLHRFGITHALLFPGLVAAFSEDQLVSMARLRAWCMGAEKASQQLVDMAIERGINIVQVYGPTETTTYALSRFMKRGDHANNLGRQLLNTELAVRTDENGIGELLISGQGLMRGYIGRTKDESFRDGFYATGDVVRVQKDGTVIFVGRNDNQVKVRGYRIELNEVENVLLRVAEQIKVLHIEEHQQLVAFVKGSLTTRDYRSRCAEALPDYMIPSRFFVLDEFPLTDNAKVDVSKLRMMLGDKKESDNAINQKYDTDKRLLGVLKKVGFRFVSLDDNFVEIGGQSIIAMRIVAEIEIEFGVVVSTHELYQTRTMRELIPLL
ncbi:hypothetical protein PFISCL1PPCAC_16121, partial [Pristionchus fissidentatus]